MPLQSMLNEAYIHGNFLGTTGISRRRVLYPEMPQRRTLPVKLWQRE